MTTAQQQIRELRKEVEELSDALAKKAKDVSNGGYLHVTRDELRDIAHSAGTNARRYFSEKKDQARAAADKYEDAVGTHPWMSTALAVAGGLILGALLRRR